MTYKIFDTLQQYNDFTLNGTHLTAGTLYLVKENKSLYFSTNNIDGETEKYEYLDEIPEGYIKPEGNIIITENGEEIDISTYATASVDVAPNLTTQNITENGTYEPRGDYDGFSSVTVNVAGSGDEVLRDLIERDITTLNIPSGTTSIGSYAFQRCTSLTNITIPDSVTSIGGYAFQRCSNLTSINIPDGVTSIGGYAFNDCSSLTSITIPSSVTGIGESVFEGCENLTSVTIGNGVTSIGVMMFRYCTSLTNITIPDSVTYIGNHAFSGCSSLTSINIPDGVRIIDQYAFNECSSLTSITIPASVTRIQWNVFYYCSSLTSVTVEAATPPTLGTNAFEETNNCPIYVPAQSVEAYKTATNWSAYADRIQPIS